MWPLASLGLSASDASCAIVAAPPPAFPAPITADALPVAIAKLADAAPGRRLEVDELVVGDERIRAVADDNADGELGRPPQPRRLVALGRRPPAREHRTAGSRREVCQVRPRPPTD